MLSPPGLFQPRQDDMTAPRFRTQPADTAGMPHGIPFIIGN